MMGYCWKCELLFESLLMVGLSYCLCVIGIVSNDVGFLGFWNCEIFV